MSADVRRKVLIFLAVALSTFAAWAQVRYPTLEDSRRAVRCSLLFAIAARDAPTQKHRQANLTVRQLMLELASMSAGTQLTLSWTDELEREVPTLTGDALMALDENCKSLTKEYRETLDFLYKRPR